MTYYNGQPIDHGLLSPSGRMSKRTKAAAIERHQAEVETWFDAKYPPKTAEQSAETLRLAVIDSLTLHAERLEAFAAQGYRIRYYTKHAAKVRAEIAEFERN